MIISHKHKFIFLHGRKCAGSSIEVALNNYLGPNDIQIGSWAETLRGNGKLNRKAIKDTFFLPSSWSFSLKQFLVSRFSKKKIDFPRFVNTSIKRCYQNKLGLNPACPTADLVMRFDPNSWKDYFKFAFARNPFDFEMSDYFWRTKEMTQKIDFKEFLKRKLKIKDDPENLVPVPSTNWPIYSINDKVVLDYIGVFEDLNYHLSFISKRIGLPLDLHSLPKVKSGNKRPSNFKNLFDNESKEMIYALHKNEFEYFKYTYPF